MELAERIANYNANPGQFLLDGGFTDAELSVGILGKLVVKEKTGWAIKNNDKYLMYCKLHDNNEIGNIKNLEYVLTEMYGRFTNKRLREDLDMGYEA